ncbi:MAG: glycogen debranching N-terminal domain-containing protein [Desulfovibrionales bacterium]
MERIICVDDQYYILATSSLADDRTRVIKEGETFGVFDRYGDIQPVGMGQQGLYHFGTRFLSRLELFLGGVRPLLLSSGVDDDNLFFSVDLANPDLCMKGQHVHRETVHIYRSKHLWQGTLYEYIRVRNFNTDSIPFALTLGFGADFMDIFEVRGQERSQRGTYQEPEINGNVVSMRYDGLDDQIREVRLGFHPEPSAMQKDEITYESMLQGRESREFWVTCSCRTQVATGPVLLSHPESAGKVRTRVEELSRGECIVSTSDESFNALLHRSIADLRMMMAETEQGIYPYAGVPWFSAPFGRDGIITALQTLWIAPEISKGVLLYLARTQAVEISEMRDAEPGKIIHEVREGEMARLGEVPFARYYGTIDATPLFVFLAAEYFRRTGETEFIESIWPNIERALSWMEEFGDSDGDGFLEYERKTAKGLLNQGWKDSGDSICHADGSLARGPIALCEVQGYAYGALIGAAKLARALGKDGQVERLVRKAADLKQRFDEEFWMEDLGMYALALDGEKKPCRVHSSNAGQCLFSGIAPPDKAEIMARALLEEDFFSGWGIRTLSTREVFYNPMSYHNGSVWPHDTSLIGWGLSLHGLNGKSRKIFEGLLAASSYFDERRLPELFCGFKRRSGEGPTLYPVACSPQSWASGSILLLFQSCLGMSIHAHKGEIRFHHPTLPRSLEHVHIRNLKVGAGCVDIVIKRHLKDVSIYVTRRKGDVQILTYK